MATSTIRAIIKESNQQKILQIWTCVYIILMHAEEDLQGPQLENCRE